jgi:ribA/ribD-fused uncharacterized protein
MKTYHFFWNGPFSQWYSSHFTENNVKYCTAEQYMMHHKALLFEDHAIAEQILKTSDPAAQKRLGRLVNNFDVQKWNEVARDIVYRGNYLKFTQNPQLLNRLLSIEADIFVEASPYDAIWGIGLNETLARETTPDKWPGSNWLGLALTKLRDELR